MNESGIKFVLYQWLSGQLGSPHVFKIIFDADFVTGNLIDASFSATLGAVSQIDMMAQVPFDTSQVTTMKNLALAIQKTAVIFKAVVTGTREITCYGALNGWQISVTGPTVIGGATQANATISNISLPVYVTVYFSDQNAPKKVWPFATIRLSSAMKVGWDEIREIDSEGIAQIGGQRRATIAINYFGPDPVQEIMKAFNSLEKETVGDFFFSRDLSILEKNPVQNLTDMLDTEFEPHAFFDFWMGYNDNVEDDLGIIQDIELTSNYPDYPLTIGPKIIGP